MFEIILEYIFKSVRYFAGDSRCCRKKRYNGPRPHKRLEKIRTTDETFGSRLWQRKHGQRKSSRTSLQKPGNEKTRQELPPMLLQPHQLFQEIIILNIPQIQQHMQLISYPWTNVKNVCAPSIFCGRDYFAFISILSKIFKNIFMYLKLMWSKIFHVRF